jgi:hypothetical protein|tara:strand:- start:138 stop:425 length:288 start_codon:yes stop_codon:yes gene_type:complete
MTQSRIPQLTGNTKEDARTWFLAMRNAGLLFDPNDDAEAMVHKDTGERFFTPEEALEANEIVDHLSALLGEELDEIVYPIYMEALGMDPYPEDTD